MNDIQKSLVDAFSIYTKDYKNLDTSRIIECTIKNIVNENIGEYYVEYLDNSFTACSNNIFVKYNTGDAVFVLIPGGDFAKQKIILGPAVPEERMFDESEASADNYIIRSTNILLDCESAILDSWENQTTDLSFNLANALTMFPEYLNQTRDYLLAFKVKTDLNPNRQTSGDYGLSLTLPVVDENNNRLTYDVNVHGQHSLLGSPYKYLQYADQKFIIHIDDNYNFIKENFTVEGFVKDFLKGGDRNPEYSDNIQITDIGLYAIELYDNKDKTGLYVIADKGNIFLKNDIDERVLTPELYINGVETLLTDEPCYWFIEDNSITSTSKDFFYLGGTGWRCLNKKLVNETNAEGDEIFTYITNEYKYVVSKDDVPFKAKYKCVIVKNDERYSGGITIKNLDSSVKIDLTTAPADGLCSKKGDKVSATCSIDVTDELKNSLVAFNWQRYNKDNLLVDTEFEYGVIDIDDTVYSQTVSFYPNVIEDYCTVKCTVLVNGEIYGSEEKIFRINTAIGYSVNVNNGNVLYKYDADGDSPFSPNYNGTLSALNMKIAPLSLTIRKPNGEELTEYEYKACTVEWFIPKDKTMLKVSSSLKEEYNDTLYVIKTDGLAQIPYDIRSVYNHEYTNNNITIVVNYDGQKIINVTNIQFTKDGEMGTNGSKYTAVINYKGVPLGTLDENGLPVKLKYYYFNDNRCYTYEDGHFVMNYGGKDQLSIKVFTNGEEILDNYNVEWSMFDTEGRKWSSSDATLAIIDVQPYDSKSCNVIHKWVWPDKTKITYNVVQAKITVNQNNETPQILYAYYPIEITYIDAMRQDISIVPEMFGGFYNVLYSSDGTDPKYNKTAPFSCNSLVEEYSDLYEYKWEVSNNFEIVDNKINTICEIKPKNKIDNLDSINFVKVSLELNNDVRTDIENKISEINQEIGETYGQLGFLGERNGRWSGAVYNFNTMYPKAKNALENNREFIQERLELFNTLSTIKDNLNSLLDLSNVLSVSIIDKILDSLENIDNAYADLLSLNVSYIELSNLSILDLEDEINAILEQDGKEIYEKVLNLTNFINDTIYIFNQNQNSFYLKFEDISDFYDIYSLLQSIRGPLVGFDEPTFISLSNFLLTKIENFDKITLDIKSYNDFNNIIEEVYNTFIPYLQMDLSNKYDKEVSDVYDKGDELIAELNRLSSMINPENTKLVHMIPIVVLTNRYELSNIADWDGNKLYLDETNNSFIYAPQMGAGYKEEDNSFTGLVMGVKQDGKNKSTGLFGFNKGRQSIFLDANTGKAEFGVQDVGQIILDPTQNKATITSGNYSEDDNTGLMIDLTTPEIKYGNGKFKVDSEGSFTSTSGSIGGWSIGPNRLYHTKGESELDFLNDTISLNADTHSINTNNHDDLTSLSGGFYLGSDGLSIGDFFRVDSKSQSLLLGYLTSFPGYPERYSAWKIGGSFGRSYISYNRAGIDDFDILSPMKDHVYIGTDGICAGSTFKVDAISGLLELGEPGKRHWQINSSKTDTYIWYGSNTSTPTINSEQNSVYIGTNGIGLGKKFQVTADGTMQVGNLSGRHWTINGNGSQAYISFNNGDSDRVYIGTDVIRLGTKFSVTSLGELTSKKGVIGGWNITENKLYSKNIFLDSDGSINHLDGAWSINSNGSAIFKDFTANNRGTIAGWAISSTGLNGGRMSINADGSMSGPGWSIDANGMAIFNDIVITNEESKLPADGRLIDFGDNFYVTKNGTLHCRGGVFSGEVNASAGKIANFTITTNSLESKDKTIVINNNGFNLGDIIIDNNGFNLGDNIKLTKTGLIIAPGSSNFQYTTSGISGRGSLTISMSDDIIFRGAPGEITLSKLIKIYNFLFDSNGNANVFTKTETNQNFTPWAHKHDLGGSTSGTAHM